MQEIRGGLAPVLRLIQVRHASRCVECTWRALKQQARSSCSASARRLLLRNPGREDAGKSDACRCVPSAAARVLLTLPFRHREGYGKQRFCAARPRHVRWRHPGARCPLRRERYGASLRTSPRVIERARALRRKFFRRSGLFCVQPRIAVPSRLIPRQVIDCVSSRECVAPNGADQSNHRFDQSVFSVVLARMHIRCHNNWKFNGYLDEDRLHEAKHPFVLSRTRRVLLSLTPIIISRAVCSPI